MKVRNGDIWGAVIPLSQLAQKPFPVKTSLAIVKLVKALTAENEPIETVRIGLLKKHGGRDERGAFTIDPGDPNFGAFAREFEDLMQTEVEIDADPVEIPDTINGEPLEIDAASLMNTEKFIIIKET